MHAGRRTRPSAYSRHRVWLTATPLWQRQIPLMQSTHAQAGGTALRRTRRRPGRRPDAVSLLKADHRQVKAWFRDFERATRGRRKQLARRICQALKIHTRIEEEVFYPAFLAAGIDLALHHEAEVEHDMAKELISAIESFGPEHEYFEARVRVLSELIDHHVKEEEQRGGMFAKARSGGLDLKQLGEQLRLRKRELEGDAEEV